MNCCRCGKDFDYDKHNGICPKCAAYNRPPGEKPYDFDVQKDFSAQYDDSSGDDSHARLHRMYDSSPAHQPQRQHAQYHRQYDNGYSHPNNPQGNVAGGQYRPQGNVAGGQYQPQGMMSGGQNQPPQKSAGSKVLKVFIIIFIINFIVSIFWTLFGGI